MEDHRMEQYKQQKSKVRAFQGQGYTLGSPAPAVVGKSPIYKVIQCFVNFSI